MPGILLRGAFAAIGLWVATFFVTGLSFDRPATLILAGLVLGLLNALLRPLLVVLTLPITLVTLGLFLLVIGQRRAGGCVGNRLAHETRSGLGRDPRRCAVRKV